MNLPGPQIKVEIVAVARIVQQVVREIFEEIKDIHQERIVEQIVNVTVPYVMKEIAEIAADTPVLQIQEQIVDVFKSIPQVRVSERVVEQICWYHRSRNMLLSFHGGSAGAGVGTHGRRVLGGGTNRSSGAVEACKVSLLICLRRKESCRTDAKVPVVKTAVSFLFVLGDFERVCVFSFGSVTCRTRSTLRSLQTRINIFGKVRRQRQKDKQAL